MDVLNPANSQFFCQKCSMYIYVFLQPIHQTFCTGNCQQSMNQYSDYQLYELSRLMQDYNLLNQQSYHDPRLSNQQHSINYEDYIPEDFNYFEYKPSTASSQNIHSQQQQNQLQQQQIQLKQFHNNNGNQNSQQNQQNSNKQNSYSQDTLNLKTTIQTNQSQLNGANAQRNQASQQIQRNGQIIQGVCQIKQQNNNLNIIDHYDESFQCHQCFNYVKYCDYSIHQTECTNQSIKCKFCSGFYPYSLINQHLLFCEQNKTISPQSIPRSSRKPNQISSPQRTQLAGLNFQLDTSDEDYESKQNDIDEHNSVDYSLNENISLYSNKNFNMEERSLTNRQNFQNDSRIQSPQRQLSTQISTTTNNFVQQNNDVNNIDNNAQQNSQSNDWSNLSPERFHQALNIIFPSFTGEHNDFRRQQNELFRNGLITRLVNISRYGLNGENNRGLSSEQQSKFIKIKYNSKQQKEYNTCSICMCDFEENEELNILDCMHRYHVECISKWFQARTSCPMCKKDMSEYMA